MKYYWEKDDQCVCKTDGKHWWAYDNDDKCFYEESPESMTYVTLVPISEAEAMRKLT